MMDIGTLLGTAVVSTDGSTRLGQVEEVLFAPEPLRVAALQVRDDDRDWRAFIPVEQVEEIGQGPVLVAIDRTPEPWTAAVFSRLVELGELQQRRVVDTDGLFVGQIQAVEVEETTGEVACLRVQKSSLVEENGEEQAIDVQAIRGIGHEELTIAGDDEPPTAGRLATP